jgi:hypothetical protein
MLGASFVFLVLINILYYFTMNNLIDISINITFLLFYFSSWFITFKLIELFSKSPCEVLDELEPKNSVIKIECSHLIIKNGICSTCELDFNNNNFEIKENDIVFDNKELKEFDKLIKEENN